MAAGPVEASQTEGSLMGDRRARLIDDGWVECPRCDGEGGFYEDSASALGIPGGVVPTDECPDCFEGLVPPDGMTEAAAKAMAGPYEWGRPGGLRQTWSALAEVALVEAERWAAKQ